MRVLCCLVLLAIAAAVFAIDPMALDESIIEAVNSHPKRSWTAGHNGAFADMRLSDARKRMGAFLADKDTTNIPTFTYGVKLEDTPKEFDARKQWPDCIHPIRDQQRCGSCWAFSATEVVSDRFCIATSGKFNEILSPEDMVSCDSSDYGCQGGYLNLLWNYYANTGTVTDKCFPYTAGGGSAPACRTTCVDKSVPFKKYKVTADSIRHFDSNDIASIQKEIMTNGPIQTGFQVYQDFFTYKSGVYRHLSGGLAGGHAVKIIGWGTDSETGLDYWLVANSWGTSWGMDGFFKILKGKDECSLESNLWAALPDTSSI